MVQGTSRVYGIIGSPITHSLSPRMQNAALSAAGIDAVYVPFLVSPDQLGPAVAGLRALGVSGFNVTIPHKCAIMPFIDTIDSAALLAGAVNTVVWEKNGFTGYNTDGEGLVRSLAVDHGRLVSGQQVVVYGAGGAVRGAVAALARHGVSRISIYNRTPRRSAELITSIAPHFPRVVFEQLSDLATLECRLATTDLLLQGTSLGMHGEVVADLNVALLPAASLVYDMVYAPMETPLIAAARNRGLACQDGLGMLVGQGELAFSLWHGVLPPVGCMRSAVTIR